MISAQLGPNTGPRPEELRDTHGLKVEGVSNLRWASNVDPMGHWPIKLAHPTLGQDMHYTYLVESAYSKRGGLTLASAQTANHQWKAQHLVACPPTCTQSPGELAVPVVACGGGVWGLRLELGQEPT